MKIEFLPKKKDHIAFYINKSLFLEGGSDS